MEINKVIQQIGLTGYGLPVVGGDVNHAFRIVDKDKSWFLKLHHGVDQSFFEAEVKGIEELSRAVRVPEIYQTGTVNEGAYLLMEWIEPGAGHSEDIGTALAKLHQLTAPQFGFSEDNYLGVLPQKNQQQDSWQNFYIENRLNPQIEIAKKNNRWNKKRESGFQKLLQHVARTWQHLEVTPRLIHGDFWGGNVFFSTEGEPVFVDPAVSYGHREMDMAIARLFGGFRNGFFKAYEEAFPLQEGWEDRLPIYQLYYLLAHLNMFGESYGSAVDEILIRY